MRAEKGFYVDYNTIKASENIDLKDIPPYAHIVNLPFTVKNRVSMHILMTFFIIGLIVLFYYLFKTNRRTREEKQAVSKALEETKLSVSISQSASWRFENGVFYFDETMSEIVDIPDSSLPEEVLRKKIYEEDLWAFDQMCRDFEKGEEKGSVKARMMTKDGKLSWFHVMYQKVFSSSEKCLYVGISQNIQSVVDNENSLIKSKRLVEKAELKESFLATMSHEIRTPLNAIVGFSTLLCEDENNELGPEDKGYYKSIIASNSKTLLGLIDDILNVSRIESGTMKFNFEEIEVGKMMDEVHSTHQILINPDLEFKYDKGFEDKVYIHVDKLRMIQVMSNFLTNANKFTKTGSITLGYALDRGKSFVHLYVADTGIGLSPEEQTVIFDRFYKNNEFIQGTGLGLSICKVIVEKLSGRIEVSSAKGKGSTFSVILPCRIGTC